MEEDVALEKPDFGIIEMLGHPVGLDQVLRPREAHHRLL
jgi:hypothetical protein